MASMLGGLTGGREYVLKIVADVKDAVKGVDTVATKTTSMKDKMLGIGKGIATGLAAAAVVKFGTDCVSAAADANDAMDAVNAAFGSSSKEIENFSKGAAENMGMSADQFQIMAAQTGNLLQSVGINSKDAAKQTEVLTQRAADMAAIWGGSTDEAMTAINKALVGGTKGLQKYGVKISASEIQTRAMAKGYTDASGKVTDAGKAIAAQELILEKTKNMQGKFAENSKDLGSQQDILKAKMRDLQVTIGTALLPIISKIMEVAAPLIDFISKNIGWLAPLAGMILGVVAAIKVWTAVQMAFNIVMTANPIVLVAAAIAALVAGIIWAYKNVKWFRDAVDAMGRAVVAAFEWIKNAAAVVFNWIKKNWPLLLAILTGPFGAAAALVIKNWDTIKNAAIGVFTWLKKNWPLLLAIITGPIGLAVLTIARHWDGIKNGFGNVIGWFRLNIRNLYNLIIWPFQQAWGYISKIGGWITGMFGGLWHGINNAMSGLADVIKWPFMLAFDAIKYLWNSTVGGFGFSVPSWIPGIGGKGFTIPEMASGGIVTRPTVALLGEAGREAVIPLDRASGLGMGAQTVVFNIYALTASSEVGKQVYNSLKEYERVSGARVGG
jgi:hypothetical protein